MRSQLLSRPPSPLFLEQLQVEVDEVEVRLGRGVVPPAQLRVEAVAGLGHACVDGHTHGRDRVLDCVRPEVGRRQELPRHRQQCVLGPLRVPVKCRIGGVRAAVSAALVGCARR
eukprot:360092-Chlamydomonas_euryale.AAC.1